MIIVPSAPDDLEITIPLEGEYETGKKLDKVIETYYTFYLHDLRSFGDYTFKINTEDKDFEIVLDKQLKTYNNIFTLDLEEQTLTLGKSLSRTMALVSLRIILTLIIEGLVFLLFGFRQKKSWISFLIINLLTQGVLNIWLNGFMPLASYLFFALVFGEFWVFIVEIIAFSFFIKEQRRGKTISYVIVANLLSLIVGRYLISVLPI